MKIMVISTPPKIFTVDVSEELELENFKAFLEVESGIASDDMLIIFNGLPLDDPKKSLASYGLMESDCIQLRRANRARAGAGAGTSTAGAQQLGPETINQLDFSNIAVPAGPAGFRAQPMQTAATASSTATGTAAASSSSSATAATHHSSSDYLDDADEFNVNFDDDPVQIRDAFLSNPGTMALLREHNERLAAALDSGDLEIFKTVLHEQICERKQRNEHRMKLLSSNPFDAEAQRLIAEEIQKKNIQDNMTAAIEFIPEIFGVVTMLYINCKVNGVPVKAFVDSGAQTTIMSATCAERCHIERLIDRRWCGIAKGVGTQRIIGRIHMVQLQIENDYLASNFSVLEEQPMDMLLGLDMLKRHQCQIDLQRNVLRIGTTGTETDFLPESELPECARLAGTPNDDNRTLEDTLERSKREMTTPSTSKQAEASASASTSTSTSAVAEHALNVLSSDNFNEADVIELMALGYKREAVIQQLRLNQGDKIMAKVALFAASLQI